ncbi:unnamed protein product [Orchesella dallaii]|uniref:Uncharacterized protein n=1 Tax=Orchesella dallaii TaxID=48710 RepID=A0ABP1Q956_9HEXA
MHIGFSFRTLAIPISTSDLELDSADSKVFQTGGSSGFALTTVSASATMQASGSGSNQTFPAEILSHGGSTTSFAATGTLDQNLPSNSSMSVQESLGNIFNVLNSNSTTTTLAITQSNATSTGNPGAFAAVNGIVTANTSSHVASQAANETALSSMSFQMACSDYSDSNAEGSTSAHATASGNCDSNSQNGLTQMVPQNKTIEAITDHQKLKEMQMPDHNLNADNGTSLILIPSVE